MLFRSTIYTEKVFVDNITESGTVTAKLALNPASLRIAPGSKDRVTINYVVKKRKAENGSRLTSK